MELTVKSFELLWVLASNPERVFSKRKLYEKVWQEDYVDDTNTLNVHIHALRQKLTSIRIQMLLLSKLSGVWAYKMEKPRGKKMKLKKLYFSGLY